MNLYLTVIDWSYDGEKQEAEWLTFVAEKYEYAKIEEKVIAHLAENVNPETESIEIDNLWINQLHEVDGFTIKLEKEKSHAVK